MKALRAMALVRALASGESEAGNLSSMSSEKTRTEKCVAREGKGPRPGVEEKSLHQEEAGANACGSPPGLGREALSRAATRSSWVRV